MVYAQSHLLSTEQCAVLTDSSVGKLSVVSPKSKGLCLCIPFFYKYPLQLNTICLQFIYVAKNKIQKNVWGESVQAGNLNKDDDNGSLNNSSLLQHLKQVWGSSAPS